MKVGHPRGLRTRLATLAVISVGIAVGIGFATPAPAQEDGGGIDTSLDPRPAVIAPRAVSALLLDIARAGNHWVVVGMRGNVLLSNDGQQWQQVEVPNNATLTRVRFADANTGWAVGYDGTVLQTADGGLHWTLLQHDASWGKPYYDLLALDAQQILLAGANGTLKRSSDGGRTLVDITSDAFEDSPNLYNLIVLSDSSLLLAGERGFLARSTDGGQSWLRLKSPYTGSYFGALAVGDSGAVIFGLRGNAFYAVDVSAAAALTTEDIERIHEAAYDPEAATDNANPVSEVAGWTELKSDEFESLFGGTVAADGTILLFGQNGHVMRASTGTGRLSRVAVDTDINMNAGAVAGDDLIVVGTSGVQRLRWTH
jgi:photosystem II stability/assembly factor-like uncharacterized protein